MNSFQEQVQVQALHQGLTGGWYKYTLFMTINQSINKQTNKQQIKIHRAKPEQGYRGTKHIITTIHSKT